MRLENNDIARQWVNIIAAPAMWVLSTLPQLTAWGRTPQEFSDANNSLLVPYGIAFSIWLPIFVGCIGYAILQGMKTNRTREIFRKTGWWTAAGFTCVCIWALFSGWGTPLLARWGTALIFIPTVLCLVKAMLILTRNKNALDKTERLWVWAPISLIAGWTSIAIFLNWTPIFSDSFGSSVQPIIPNLLMLCIALAWAVFVTRRSGANMVYAFPIIWGLAWLAFKALTQAPKTEIIAISALMGVIIIIGAIFSGRDNSQTVFRLIKYRSP
ncbi:hypothetical protein [Hellea balneolensis]|uniref:hypothetical protein n=1 Tax=Hellea balneolensis TaxID=287478 RepID=UPI0004037166|nr:hypothetical protein [Hellea balneolensis]